MRKSNKQRLQKVEGKEITYASVGHVKVGGKWYEETSKVMVGHRIVKISTRCGKTFNMSEIEVR